MLRSSESETEILLGNKQLLGIFFVVAVLLGVAFAGGYMVGKGPAKKAANVVSASDETATATPPPAGGETHSVGAAESPEDRSVSNAEPAPTLKKVAKATAPPAAAPANEEPPLGSPNRKSFQAAHEAAPPPEATMRTGGGYVPQDGQTFLQVAAVGRDEAEAVADVLHKKGFRAHAAQIPGNVKLYRVLIGPIRDPGDLSATRDSLRKTGFREVIVKRF